MFTLGLACFLPDYHTYCFGDTESVPENKSFGNGIWRAEPFGFGPPETKGFGNGFGSTDSVAETLGFGNVISGPENSDFPECLVSLLV
jgi:hypothetical protein